MKKITVRVNENIYKEIEEYRAKNGHKNMTESTRELIHLALKIIDTASELDENNNETSTKKMLEELKKLLKKNTEWVLEARLLTRFLVEKLDTSNGGSLIKLIEDYKNRAEIYVAGLWDGSKN